ncbi:MAG: hypothetical protein ABIJ96_10450 [Elusimicrobiota bacterium]
MDSARAAQPDRRWDVAAWLLLLPVLLHPIGNPDIFWHLKSAEMILQSGVLPRADFFSYTLLGTPWIDFEWLIQLIYYGIHSAAGFPGLLALKAAMLVMSALPVWALAELYRLSRPQRAALLLFWGALMLARSDLKPETFSIILFTIQLWLLEARRLGRIKAPHPAFAAAGAFLYFAFWANLHPAFVSGLILLAAYGLERPRETRRENAALITAAVLGTLLNPYGSGIYQVLWEHGRAMPAISRFIFEWQPPRFDNPYDIPTWLLIAAAAAAMITQVSWGRRPPASHLGAAAVFCALFLLHSRNKAFLIPVGLMILADAARPVATWLRRMHLRLGRFLLILFVLSYLAYVGHYANPELLRYGAYAIGLQPVGAADFIERELPTLRKRRIFNQWGWGGYLSYRFHPEIRVFMDGRYIFHPFLDKIAQAHESPVAWQNFLGAHDIEWLLVRNNRETVQIPAQFKEEETRVIRIPYQPVYYPSRRWALVYRDRQAVLYARRGAFPEDWIRRHEIR